MVFALIFSLIFGQVLRFPLDFLGLPGAGVVPSDLILVFLAVILFFQRPAILASKLGKPIIFFLGIGFISLVFNRTLTLPQFLVSFLYLLRFGLLAGIYFIVREFAEKTKFQLQVGLIVAGVSTAILGLIQYFLYPDLRNLSYDGWDEHLYRVFSTFLDPNFAGAFFVLTLILIMGFLLNRRPKNIFVNWGLIGGVVLIFIALLLTYSRSAFLMFFAGGFVLFFFYTDYSNNRSKIKNLFLLAGLFIIGLGFISWSAKILPSEGTNLLRVTSITARVEETQRALAIFRRQPLFGVGFNAYRFAQERQGFLEVKTSHAAAGTDNSFLFVLATTGVVGFFAFLYLWFRIFKLAYSLRDEMAARVVLASCVGLFINSLFINSLFFESILVWLWVLIGIMEKR